MNKNENTPEEEVYEVLKVSYLNDFRCDSSKCLDNCCSKYLDIGVDDKIVDIYKKEKPELLSFIIERKSNKYNYSIDVSEDKGCIHFHEGKCNIHKQYGERYLPEVCWYYPRLYKRINNSIVLTIALPCSEVIRLVLFGKENFGWEKQTVNRLPEVTLDFITEGLDENEAQIYLDFHHNILDWVKNSNATSEEILLKLIATSKVLDKYARYEWASNETLMDEIKEAFDKEYNFKEYEDVENPTHQEFVSTLSELTTWYKNKNLTETMERIEAFSGDEKFVEKYNEIAKRYFNQPNIDYLLKRYLMAKICESTFPSAYWWTPVCKDEILFKIHNYIAIKLALASHIYHTNTIPTEDEVVRYIFDIEGYFYGRCAELEEKYQSLNFSEYEHLTALLSCLQR